MLGGLLLTLVISSWCSGKGLSQYGPDSGFSATVAPSDSISPEKLKKLNEALNQAAKAYRAGQFDQAAKWYQGALQLEPGRENIQQLLENARPDEQNQR